MLSRRGQKNAVVECATHRYYRVPSHQPSPRPHASSLGPKGLPHGSVLSHTGTFSAWKLLDDRLRGMETDMSSSGNSASARSVTPRSSDMGPGAPLKTCAGSVRNNRKKGIHYMIGIDYSRTTRTSWMTACLPAFLRPWLTHTL